MNYNMSTRPQTDVIHVYQSLSRAGGSKTNTIDEFFHVGYTWDRHAEFINRPIIITALELCTAEVVDFLLKFGANLSKEHEGE